MPDDPGTPAFADRRASLLALLGFALAGCGGGGSDGGESAMAGTLQSRSLAARRNGTTYPLNIYLPPGIAAIRASVPVIYLLDGDSRFGGGRRHRRADPGAGRGGGQGAYLDFIRADLIPFIETRFGGDPLRRILLGHSHGGSFVLYALFNEAPAGRHVAAYLASDASIDCMNATVYGWESDYAAANAALTVRLHISYSANAANTAFAQQVQGRGYAGLAMAAKFYAGGHIGMIPAAFTDAIAFALA